MISLRYLLNFELCYTYSKSHWHSILLWFRPLEQQILSLLKTLDLFYLIWFKEPCMWWFHWYDQLKPMLLMLCQISWTLFKLYIIENSRIFVLIYGCVYLLRLRHRARFRGFDCPTCRRWTTTARSAAQLRTLLERKSPRCCWIYSVRFPLASSPNSM